MFTGIVLALMALAVAVAGLTLVSGRRAGVSPAIWPFFALAAFVLIESRVFVDTPSLTDALQANPSDETTSYIGDRVSDLLIGGGVTMLGIACAGVFFAGLARHVRASVESSIAPWLIAIGGAATVGMVGAGSGLFSVIADAGSSDCAPTTVAAIYTIFDSLLYVGFTAMGLVTAGVALASLRERAFSPAIGRISATATGLFAICAFLPFLSWAPALLWLLVAGIALAWREGRETRTLARVVVVASPSEATRPSA
jgi:hypothetical protein